MSGTHPLDHPIWSALTTTQQHLAEGGALARRYPPEITPFADMADMSGEGFAALGDLMTGPEIAVLFTPEIVTPPAGFDVLLAKPGEQMIGASGSRNIRCRAGDTRRCRRGRDDGADRVDQAGTVQRAHA